MATLENAQSLCIVLENIAPKFGYHVGLTGGALYKDGNRKDVDILLYQIRQEKPNKDGLLSAFVGAGMTMGEKYGWLQKAWYQDMNVDLLFPEYKPTILERLFGAGWDFYIHV